MSSRVLRLENHDYGEASEGDPFPRRLGAIFQTTINLFRILNIDSEQDRLSTLTHNIQGYWEMGQQKDSFMTIFQICEDVSKINCVHLLISLKNTNTILFFLISRKIHIYSRK